MTQKRQIKVVLIGLTIIVVHQQCMGQGNYHKTSQYSQPNSQYNYNQVQFGSGPQKKLNYNQQYNAAAQQPPQDRNDIGDLTNKVEDIRRFVNLTQDPCVDFYDYACGNWLQFQNLVNVKEGDTLSVADQLERKVNVQLQKMLTPRGGSLSVMAVKNFYSACTQATLYNQKSHIKQFVNSYGGLPEIRDMPWQGNTYEWTRVVTNLKRVFNLDILIALTKSRDEPVLEEPQQTILPADLCSSFAVQQMEVNDEIYNAKQLEIKNSLQSWIDINGNTADRLAGDILKFEFELCKHMRKADMLYIAKVDANETADSGIYNPYEQKNVNGRPLNVNPNRNLLNTPEASGEFADFVEMSLGRRTTYRTSNDEYFQYLSNMIRTRKASLTYYIMYRALSELAIPQDQPRSQRAFFCVRKAMQFFPGIMGNIYQSKLTNEKKALILEDVKSIFDDIKEVMRENAVSVKNLQLTAPLVQQIESPFANITNANYWQFLIAMQNGQHQPQRQQFPRQQSTDATNVVESFATTVSSNDRMLQFGWGLLQAPFYSFGYPKSIKYSSIGYALARELMKSSDQTEGADMRTGVITRGGNPRSVGAMDGPAAANKECFRAQVSSYFYNTPDVYRNGTQLRDIIADASAVNIAFAAYSKWLQKQNPVTNRQLMQETFPNIYFTNTQLFFVNYAVSRCAAQYQADNNTSEFFPMDRHTLERFNVNGPLSNSLEFGRDFNCPIGSEMNIDDKCSMFGEGKEI